MKFFSRLGLLAVSLYALGTFNAKAQTVLNDSITRGTNFETIALRLWLDKSVKQIRGIVVVVPGSNGDGRDMVLDTAWQNLARRHKFALVGCYMTDKPHEHMAIERYVDVKLGSGQAFLDVLTRLALQSGHVELEQAPMVLFGESAGGQFNYEMVCWKPERVIAFVVNKGGIYYSSLAPATAWEVPGLFITGEKDSPFRNNIINGIFSINRRFGAQWMLVEEPGVGHEFENSRIFSRLFFEQVISLRLSDSGSLRKLSNGWVGYHSTKEITDAPKDRPTQLTSWFATKPLSDLWLCLMR